MHPLEYERADRFVNTWILWFAPIVGAGYGCLATYAGPGSILLLLVLWIIGPLLCGKLLKGCGIIVAIEMNVTSGAAAYVRTLLSMGVPPREKILRDLPLVLLVVLSSIVFAQLAWVGRAMSKNRV